MLDDAQWAQVAKQLAEIQAASDRLRAGKHATRRTAERCIFDHTPPKGRSHPHWTQPSRS